MSFTNTIRQILSENGGELTTVEIRELIRSGHPHYYGTRSHRHNVDVGNYSTIDAAVIAQINSSVRQAKDISEDPNVRPKRVVYFPSTPAAKENEIEEIASPEPKLTDKENEPTSIDEPSNNQPSQNNESHYFTLKWNLCETYDSAKDFTKIIYLHESRGKPFYWGIARNSFFGGHTRTINGFRASGRYNSGYRHWIEGCLASGAKLYIAEIVSGNNEFIAEVETKLINTHRTEANKRVLECVHDIIIEHTGSVPTCCLPAYLRIFYGFINYGSDVLRALRIIRR